MPTLANFERFESLVKNGMLYGHGRDREERPIIVFDMRRWIDSKITPEELLGTIDFLNAYTIFNAQIPGKIEQSNWIIDMKDVSLYEIPLKTAASIIVRNTKYYKHRMHSISTINLSWIITVAIKFIENLLDPFEKSKNHF